MAGTRIGTMKFSEQDACQAGSPHSIANARNSGAICPPVYATKEGRHPDPDNDLWIAALTLEHALTLITRDKHFRYIPQLLLG